METKFAPAERKNRDAVFKEFNNIRSLEYIQEFIDALPFVTAVLNEERQIIFANEKLLQFIGINSIEDILGARQGEMLRCIHSSKEIGGCGTTENCKFCGAVNSVIKSQKLKTKVIDECRITSKKNNEIVSYDFQISATPFSWLGKEFTIITFLDISSEKRKRALERIFFHDIINKTGSLHGFLSLLKNIDDERRIKDIIKILEETTYDLNDEILAQRQLLEAENKDLKVKPILTNCSHIINSVAEQMKHHEVGIGKEIIIDPHSNSIEFITDPILLKRVLTNMIKNALEASSENQNITIGYKHDENFINFWVHNQTTMSRKAQLQIFQRSFSTKGASRGLGTYSMKLIGEKYLKGKVSFESSEKDGTKFMINVPLSIS